MKADGRWAYYEQEAWARLPRVKRRPKKRVELSVGKEEAKGFSDCLASDAEDAPLP